VSDRYRVVRVGQRADPVEAGLVALGHAFVLAEVLVPGRDHELLGIRPGSLASRQARHEVAPARRRLNLVCSRTVTSSLSFPGWARYCTGPAGFAGVCEFFGLAATS
jgi:hypothetical protein